MSNNNQKYRVGFAGRGELGYQVLLKLLKNPHITVPLIITSRSSADIAREEGEFQELAEKHEIPFYQSNSLNTPECVELFNSHSLDLVCALFWLNTISGKTIRTAKDGFLNLHGGLLPKYRGNATQTWAILNGEKEQGITAHLMDPDRLDTGDIILQKSIPIAEDTVVGELYREVSLQGIELVVKAVEKLRLRTANKVPQDDKKALYCYPRLPRDGEINWNHNANDILKLIRAAGSPYPGAYSYYSDIRDGNKIKKVVIHNAHLEKHPTNFCAVPGHVLKVHDGNGRAVVTGDHQLLLLDRIEIDARETKPVQAFRTVRQRLGLDTEALLRFQLNTTGKNQTQELQIFQDHMEEITQKVLQSAKEKHLPCRASLLTNHSYQRGFCHWEQKERFYGVQLYQSIDLMDEKERLLTVGYWLFTDDDQGLEKRIYLSGFSGDKALLKDLLQDQFPRYEVVERKCGFYLGIPNNSSREVIDKMLALLESAYTQMTSTV